MRAVVAVVVAIAACTSDEASPGTSATSPLSTTISELAPSATTTVPTTTSAQPTHRVGLYRVDPATLTPLPGREPLTTGDWISGELSPNGEWLALRVSYEDALEAGVIQVIETSTGEMVTEVPSHMTDIVGVGDDGGVYQVISWTHRSRLRKLAPGSDRYETVVDVSPHNAWWGGGGLFDNDRAVWWGKHNEAASMIVNVLSGGEVDTHLVEEVTIGVVGATEAGGWELSESVSPAVVWDHRGDRLMLVHGDQNRVTVLDLGTAARTTHEWTESISWLDRLFVWLVPPAQADGPSGYGVERNAALSPDGDVLYVGTSVSQLVVETEDDWYIKHAPQGVEVISTVTWQLLGRWDIPAAEVWASPDGRYLAATGVTHTESPTASHRKIEEVFVIDTTNNELAGSFDPRHNWPEVQFSPDGRFMYISEYAGGGPIDIVDLTTMEFVGHLPRIDPTVLFAEALLIATPLR